MERGELCSTHADLAEERDKTQREASDLSECVFKLESKANTQAISVGELPEAIREPNRYRVL